jgi:hypothetical protein
MHSKYTNEELYQWQVGQISGVYFQSYKLAYDLAKRAERCFRFELGLQDSSYISFGYWDSLKKGLLSGEKLQYDLRRLEAAYLEQNRRELELTKHVSLLLLDPLALVRLRETGKCLFNLHEELFDLDYPGHYFRRIKSVSLTLPCVTGPYTTIACTLRLLNNSIRINTAKGGGWRLGLPSGQHVAQQMGVKPMDDKDILIGQGVDKPDKALPNILSVSAAFKQNCPLWTYILAEAMHFKEAVKAPVTKDITIQTPRLGPVGGRIVAEVFLGLMHGDKNSMLNLAPNWQPDAGPDFKLKDFVKYAVGK